MPRRLAPPPDFVPPSGRCECGCGQFTPICRNSSPRRGQYFGYHLRFIHGHHARGQSRPKPSGEQSWKWKGGISRTVQGYVRVMRPDHPDADTNGYVLEHRWVWEQTHGPIQPDVHVHHIDGNKSNNAIENLVALTKSAHSRHHAEEQRHNAERRAQISASMKRVWAERRHR